MRDSVENIKEEEFCYKFYKTILIIFRYSLTFIIMGKFRY